MKDKGKGILVVVSGFSGAGKGTLMAELIRKYDGYALSISMTTRAPRTGETNGTEYFFVTKEEFEDCIREDGLVEYAQYVDNYYGTPRSYVEEQLNKGNDVILEIEIQGALKIKEKYPESLLLFVTPPNMMELEKRLLGRGTETEAVIKKRLKRAEEESEGIEAYEYLVINDDLDECTQKLHQLIQMSHDTPNRNRSFLEQIRVELAQINRK